MTDRPILFSAAMVLAILREIAAPGTGKTQTRRVLKPQPVPFEVAPGRMCEVASIYVEGDPAPRLALGNVITTQEIRFAPGDRLWVRETWTARMTHGWTIADARSRMYQEEILYKADNHDSIDGWWPAIHMPREFSRLTLHVTDVRVQRLHDISEDDARAEGIECDSDGWRDYLMPATQCCGSARNSFATLWDSLNAERAPWASNPWVVAVTFRPEAGNIDRVAA